MLERILGKKTESFTLDQLREIAAKYDRVHVDLGTGDGLFVWRLARENPDMLCIGFDSARENVADAAAKSLKKPARGGAENALFFCANVLELPEGLDVLADRVSINFPWGSLLQVAAQPDEVFMQRVFNILKSKAALDVFINLFVFQQESERLNLDLPELTELEVLARYIPVMDKVGFSCLGHQFIPEGERVDVASSWGRKLTRSSKRPTLEIHFEKKS